MCQTWWKIFVNDFNSMVKMPLSDNFIDQQISISSQCFLRVPYLHNLTIFKHIFSSSSIPFPLLLLFHFPLFPSFSSFSFPLFSFSFSFAHFPFLSLFSSFFFLFLFLFFLHHYLKFGLPFPKSAAPVLPRSRTFCCPVFVHSAGTFYNGKHST